MKKIMSAMLSAITPKTYIATVSNDYGQSFQHAIRAHSYRAALREAYTFTDTDWYSVTVAQA